MKPLGRTTCLPALSMRHPARPPCGELENVCQKAHATCRWRRERCKTSKRLDAAQRSVALGFEWAASVQG